MILTKKKEILSTKSMILSALFVALIAIGAFIKVPVPVCPFTLQLLFPPYLHFSVLYNIFLQISFTEN